MIIDHQTREEISVKTEAVLTALAVYQQPISQQRLMHLLHAGLNNKTEQDTWHIKKILENLIDSQQVLALPKMGFQIDMALGHTILLKLSSKSVLLKWIGIVQTISDANQEYVIWHKNYPAICEREILFAALKNDLVTLGTWRSKLLKNSHRTPNLLANTLLSTPSGTQLFEQFSPAAQSILLVDVFSHANWALSPCNQSYEYACARIETLFKNDTILLDVIFMQALLRGEYKDVFNKIEVGIKQKTLASPIISLIEGNSLGSAIQFDKLHCAHPDTQYNFLPGIPGLFLTVAHLTQHSEHAATLTKQVYTGCQFKEASFYAVIKPLVEQLLHANTPELNTHTSPGFPLDTLFVYLAHFWQNQAKTESDRLHLYRLFSQSAQHGYSWVAAEIDQLRHHQFNEPLEWHDWHTSRHLQPLCNLFGDQEKWKQALLALTKLSHHDDEEKTRMTWLITQHGHHLQLEAREQKMTKEGLWGRTKAISLKRLFEENNLLFMLSEQDRQIAYYVYHYQNNHTPFPTHLYEKMLPYLIGHPAIYWQDNPDSRIDFVKGEISLQITQKKESIYLSLIPAIPTKQHAFLEKMTSTRMVVYIHTNQTKQINAILGSGLSIPLHGKDVLIEMIQKLSPSLAIQTDCQAFMPHTESVRANEMIYAYLLPFKKGLRVQFLVQPLPEGPWFVPGEGNSHVSGKQLDKSIHISRNLKKEAAQLKIILKKSPTLYSITPLDHEWHIEDPQLCLALLTEFYDIRIQHPNMLTLIWPEGVRFSVSGTLSSDSLHMNVNKRGNWLSLNGHVTLDDGKIIDLKKLIHLHKLANGHFLALDDHHFIALTNRFKAQLQTLSALSQEKENKDGIQISSLAVPVLKELSYEMKHFQADKNWDKYLKHRDVLFNQTPDVPCTLQAQLRDYQISGYHWLSRLASLGMGACLADDMGLGKTLQMLALILSRAENGPTLVVAPTSVTLNWQIEAARFAPILHIKMYQENRIQKPLGPFDLVIVSYGLLQQDATYFIEQNWETVVLDEAQVIKNNQTKRSQTAMKLTAHFRMIASGTPVENNLNELWSLFQFINPGLLGSNKHFHEHFVFPIKNGDGVARTYLKKLIQPFILRRTKTQVLHELPPRTDITLQVSLTEEERHLYEALRQTAVENLSEETSQHKKTLQVLAAITKLRRFCCHPQLSLPNSSIISNINSSKLKVLDNIVDELLQNNHKALVFSQFVDYLSIVRDYLDKKGVRYLYLDGSTSHAERKKRVAAFQNEEADIFLISLKAGGTGLNLTTADYVIHLDPWWNPAVEDQASDRAYRMGQVRPVTIYRLVTEHTIESKILALHAQKRALAEHILEGGDASAHLDTESLLNLLREK